jgi:hypothetical protein
MTMKAMIGALALAGAAVLASASPAAAQAPAQGNVMKECAAKYQAAKAGKTLPAGQSWMQYLAACRGTASATSATKATSVHSVTTSTTTKTNVPVANRAPTPSQVAERSRQKQCGAQWKADKAAGKTGAQTWPQYWSACSKRLKG